MALLGSFSSWHIQNQIGALIVVLLLVVAVLSLLYDMWRGNK